MTSDRDKLSFFNETHMISIILYIYDHPGCRRTEIYKNIVRNDRMTVKIDRLISEGIVEDLSRENRGSILFLTSIGEKIAEHLQAIADLLESD